MLELGIIICLAVVLFLVLRNFPESSEGLGSKTGEKKVINFWKKVFHSRKKTLDSIQREIEKNKDKVISPIEIEAASDKFKEEDPETTRTLIDAERCFLENNLRDAEDMAISVLSKEKKCAGAYVLLGQIAFQRGEFDDAEAAYKTALKCNLEFADAYVGLGSIQVKNENFTDAIDSFHQAISLDRGQAEWWCYLGLSYMEVRQFAKAAKAFKKAASIDVDNKRYKQLAAEAEEKQRSHAMAFRKR